MHLASIVTPGKDSNREFEYSVDVQGTENVLTPAWPPASEDHRQFERRGLRLPPDNPAWLTEDRRRCAATRPSPMRGTSAWWRRCWRAGASSTRELKQVVFRIGTILGETVRNQITDLFEKPRPLAIRGADSPFVFIWDQDVVGCILQAIATETTGIYNVAGDGALTIHEIAARLGKRCRVLPAWAAAAARWRC